MRITVEDVHEIMRRFGTKPTAFLSLEKFFGEPKTGIVRLFAKGPVELVLVPTAEALRFCVLENGQFVSGSMAPEGAVRIFNGDSF